MTPMQRGTHTVALEPRSTLLSLKKTLWDWCGERGSPHPRAWFSSPSLSGQSHATSVGKAGARLCRGDSWGPLEPSEVLDANAPRYHAGDRHFRAKRKVGPKRRERRGTGTRAPPQRGDTFVPPRQRGNCAEPSRLFDLGFPGTDSPPQVPTETGQSPQSPHSPAPATASAPSTSAPSAPAPRGRVRISAATAARCAWVAPAVPAAQGRDAVGGTRRGGPRAALPELRPFSGPLPPRHPLPRLPGRSWSWRGGCASCSPEGLQLSVLRKSSERTCVPSPDLSHLLRDTHGPPLSVLGDTSLQPEFHSFTLFSSCN